MVLNLCGWPLQLNKKNPVYFLYISQYIFPKLQFKIWLFILIKPIENIEFRWKPQNKSQNSNKKNSTQNYRFAFQGRATKLPHPQPLT